MPYKSLAQERYFNANRAKLEKQGVDVDEYNQASKGMSLPKRAKGVRDGDGHKLGGKMHPQDSRRGIGHNYDTDMKGGGSGYDGSDESYGGGGGY